MVLVPTGNLTVLCLGFNLLVLLRKLGQPSLRFYDVAILIFSHYGDPEKAGVLIYPHYGDPEKAGVM